MVEQGSDRSFVHYCFWTDDRLEIGNDLSADDIAYLLELQISWDEWLYILSIIFPCNTQS